MKTFNLALVKLKCFFICFLFCSLLSSCGEENTQDKSIKSETSSQYLIKGTAAKGALINADINVFNINSAGIVDETTAVFKTVTNEFGQFSINLDSFENELIIKTSGGSYIDE